MTFWVGLFDMSYMFTHYVTIHLLSHSPAEHYTKSLAVVAGYGLQSEQLLQLYIILVTV